MASKDYEALKVVGRMMVKAEPGNPQHLISLAQAYKLNGEFDEAIELLENAVGEASDQNSKNHWRNKPYF